MRFEYAHFNSMDFGSYGLGASVSPMGSQLMQTNMSINWGLQNLEVNLGTQMNFQQAGHLAQLGKIEREEMIRLAKLNRVNLSVHAPLFCAAGGYGEGMNETTRIKAVQELKESIKFADQIGSKTKVQNIPVVIHSVGQVPGNPMPEQMMYVADPETGRIILLERKEVVFPKAHLEKYHLKEKKKGDESGDYEVIDKNTNKILLYPQGKLKMVNKDQLDDMNREIANIRHQIHFYEQYAKEADMALQNPEIRSDKEQFVRLQEQSKMYHELRNQLIETEQRVRYQIEDLKQKYQKEGEFKYLVPTDELAKQKAIKSFVELGYEAYNKPSKPMIVVEQFSPELALGDPRKTAQLVKDAREELAKKLVKEKGFSMDHARKEASQVLAMNFDIGHANLWKRYGKKYNDKEILKWVDEIAPVVKHVHITDNFGDYDAHLPVGWGNAPIHEVMSKLKEKGWKGRAILETFGAVQYGGGGFGVPASLYSFGMPLVPGGPTWETAGRSYFEAGYSFTSGPILPDVNFQSYGVGFSGLPYATGAQIGGGKPGEKFSGTPMS
ncbi:MAG: TIM barrel protein [Candidatus Omnitrophica bacterium]|nr:TIM barrel protein [Candidatus Omnitrophota bacterium]